MSDQETTEVVIKFKTNIEANALAMLAESGELDKLLNTVLKDELIELEPNVFYSQSVFEPHLIEY